MRYLLAISLSISLTLGVTGLSYSTISVFSNSSTLVSCPEGTEEELAVPALVHPEWTAQIPGATWIWGPPKISTPTTEYKCEFSIKVKIPGHPITADMYLAADSTVYVTVNSKLSPCSSDHSSFQSETQVSCSIKANLHKGVNRIKFVVIKPPGESTGGLLYHLFIVYGKTY